MGQLIEDHIGHTGRKLFFLFSWLFTLLVIAAFADMVAGTFNGFSESGEALQPNASAASISILYVFVAIAFGLFLRKTKISGWKQAVIAIALILLMLAAGIAFPVYLGKQAWIYIVFVYIFFASITPMWLLKQPRDYLTTFLFIGMIAAAVIGVFVSNPTITTPAFTGFVSESGSYLFPTLFVTIACGAVSGFHSLVSSETSSKQIRNEKDMLQVGYGSMLLESLLAVLVIVVVGSLSSLSASGVLNAREIAHASDRLIGIALGAEDYVTDLKTTRSDGIELLFARSMILNAARSAGIAALDTVYSDVNNEEGFIEEVTLIRKLGFDGKSVINPRQIEPLHRTFIPSEKDLKKAYAIMDAIAEANARGSGVASLNGKMIDKPVVIRAQRLIALAEADNAMEEE